MIAGIYDASYGGYWGCWFYSVRRQVEARLVSGMVDVSREGDIYTLELKLKDGAGRNVTATYTGPRNFQDRAGASQGGDFRTSASRRPPAA